MANLWERLHPERPGRLHGSAHSTRPSLAVIRECPGRVRECPECFGITRNYRMNGDAIAEPETGYSPGDLINLSCCNAFWILRPMVTRKYDKWERRIDIPSIS
jgi:hypothetical protein